MLAISKQTATVWRGGRRRYFSRAAAYRGAARAAVNERCECSEEDHGPMGRESITCGYHRDGALYAYRVIERLARWLAWRDALSAGKAGGR